MKIPEHVAIIMDGNGRWAKSKGLPRIYGHREGAKAVERVVEYARKRGIKYLTLYAFSTENWKRPYKEIKFLFSLLIRYLKKEEKKLLKNDIRLFVIGDRNGLPEDVVKKINEVESKTKDCKSMTLILAINYGGRDEIMRGMKKFLKDFKKGKVKSIDEGSFKDYLDLKNIPEPDLLIRTSGEMRISNFLIWHIAYSELYFTKTLWPDFDEKEFEKAIRDYTKRERRFGGL